MKENRYFKGQDLRATESPYEAVFELAERFHQVARLVRVLILVLAGIFVFYSIGIIAIIVFNIFYGTAWTLNMFAVLFSSFLLILAAYTLSMLFKSNRFLRDLHAHHSLLKKIEGLDVQGLKRDSGPEPAVLKGRPKKGVIELIYAASEHSGVLKRIFNLIIGFIVLWYFAGVLYFAIQIYRFGGDILHWRFDWLIPGGIDLFLTVSATIIIYIVRTAFDFVRERYLAIEYAMNLPPVKVPAGATSIVRYRTYLSSQKGYEHVSEAALWKSDGYFDAAILGKKGWLFIKSFERLPKQGEIQEFRHEVLRGRGKKPLDRAVIIYPENTAETLPDEVYNEVIEEPIRHGREVCTIQLVGEDMDGTYDFVPAVAF